MRHAADIDRDPLNVEAVGDVGSLGIDYRTQIKSPRRLRSYSIYLIASTTVFALAGTLLLRILGGTLATSLWLAVFILVGVVVGMIVLVAGDYRVVAADALGVIIPAVALPAFLWWALYSATWLADPIDAYLVPFLGTFLLCIYFAERLADHRVRWILANPWLLPEEREAWTRLWNSRFMPDRSPAKPPSIPGAAALARRASQAMREHRRAYVLLATAYFAGAAVLLIARRSGGIALLLSGTLAVATVAGVLLATRPVHSRRNWRVVRDALVSWLTYNAHHTRAPGVFSSPGGPWASRTGLASAVFGLMVFVVAPMACYFPCAVPLTGPDPWVRAIQRQQRGFFLRSQQPTFGWNLADVERELTPAQRQLFNQIPEVDVQRRVQFLQAVDAQWIARELRASAAGTLARTPESWLVTAAYGLTFAEASFLWSLLLALILSLTVPPLLVILTVRTMAGPVLVTLDAAIERRLRRHPPRRHTQRQYHMRRLAAGHPSGDSEERDPRKHLWLGTALLNDYPVLLHRDVLAQHAHILGDSGAGKTSLALAPLVSELARALAAEKRDGGPGGSIVILDIKGDPAFFQGARADARLNKLPFKWFTIRPGDSTYAFNPMNQAAFCALTPDQRTEILASALGLQHGEGYGKSYFSRMNRDVLAQALQKNPDAQSFLAIDGILKDKSLLSLREKDREDAGELVATIAALAQIDAINVIRSDAAQEWVSDQAVDCAIQMEDVVAKPQIVYFYLEAAIGQSSVREIAKLALFSLLNAALAHSREHRKPPCVYLVIDEFQRIISDSLDIILQQARSMGISVILANHTINDLKRADADLIPVVQANTAFKQFFSAGTVEQIRSLQALGGEVLYDQAAAYQPEDVLGDDYANWPRDEDGRPLKPEKPVVGPRITTNDMLRMTDDPYLSIVHITHGRGLTQFQGFPFIVRSEHHITFKRYQARARRRWPQASNETIVAPIVEDRSLRSHVTALNNDNAKASNASHAKAVIERLQQFKNAATAPPPRPAATPHAASAAAPSVPPAQAPLPTPTPSSTAPPASPASSAPASIPPVAAEPTANSPATNPPSQSVPPAQAAPSQPASETSKSPGRKGRKQKPNRLLPNDSDDL